MATLADIMTKDVFTTGPDAAISEVVDTMVRRRFGSVVVTRGPVLVGIFTERDVLRAAASGADLTATPVSKWMTPDPETADPHLGVDQAAESMLSGGFRHLPIVDGNTLAGIVSLRDLLSSQIRRRTQP